jgi:hypothetical protein
VCKQKWSLVACGILFVLMTAGIARAQTETARRILENAAEAMGGLDRLQGLDNFVLTGFGQAIYQGGGGNVTGDLNAPPKWQAIRDAQRSFDLVNERALNQDRRSSQFPFASPRGSNRSNTLQAGVGMLNHPLSAVLEALDSETSFGRVTTEDGLEVVEFTIEQGDTLWIGVDPQTHLPSWVRWISGSGTLGDLTNTAYFTGYLPFDGVRLPVGLMHKIDWRDTVTLMFQVDSYRVDVEDLPEFPAARGGFGGNAGGAPQVDIEEVADGVWDLKVGGSGGAVIEFADHLTMFEAYGSEANALARIDTANRLVPGKEVTELIVTHHHFDHTGGLRAAVSRGLTVIAHRGNRQIFEEMISRPAPNFPDALARNPQPLRFIPVDEHLVLEDDTMLVDIYHSVGHTHMANAVVGYIPEHRIFMEGDYTTFSWEWHWWGDAYLDTVELYDLDPVTNIPVHGIVTTFDDAIRSIEEQALRARAFCADNVETGIAYFGCPVQYSHDIE